MRTVKASEVVKGMQVEAELHYDNGDRVCIAGVVTDLFIGRTVTIDTENNSISLEPDHPVTVLAEPEPEWVEGAWYWVELQEKRTLMRRVGRGWSSLADAAHAFHNDNHVTVLGRVLIVDWPGDDVALSVSNGYGNDFFYAAPVNLMLQSVADAIRTQGGVR